jgi:hypothetical protein
MYVCSLHKDGKNCKKFNDGGGGGDDDDDDDDDTIMDQHDLERISSTFQNSRNTGNCNFSYITFKMLLVCGST